uniref:Uncharacterized protein n=1 Tax=Avena sativa TaxID=4498 RepID=A0ACD5ZUX4_AVESA
MAAAYQQPLHQQHSHKPSSTYYYTSSAISLLGPRTVLAWLLSAVLCLALLHLLCCSQSQRGAAVSPLPHHNITAAYNQGASTTSGCDYSEGRWVWAPGHARRYNGTECNVKGSENCVRNGRPDTGYLDWRWQPSAPRCPLPDFDAAAFLAAVRGRHVAFLGDSMARNQAESLVCLLSSASSSSFPYRMVYQDPEPGTRKFWRWAFPSHHVTVSVYWAPFLARAAGKSENYSVPYNSVFLDELAERWSADADTMDVAVVSAGHWFWNPTVYYNGSEVLGTHQLSGLLNHTEIGFFSPYREAIRMTLRRLVGSARARTVVAATFSPPHFEKAWDDPATCTRSSPYREGERDVDAMHAELRSIVREEAAAAAARNVGGAATRVEVLDVTKLATMRPDGHPGVYMKRDPFARGVPERLQSDCLHFCLPGPVDTFNQILLQILTKRQ